MKIQYVGHATLLIETYMKIIIDPYLKGKGKEGLSRYNPNAALSVEDVEEVSPDLILLTHGHGDHFGQTFELLEGTDAKLIASNRVCDFLKKKFGEKRLLRIEPNEELKIDKLTVLALEAKHKHGLERFGGDMLGLLAYKRRTPCGTNMGYLISVEGKKIYHSGDTYVVRGVHNPDIAFLSMDGFRTLNDAEAMEVIRAIKPKIVVPIHFKWYDNGEKIVEKVKGIIEREEADVLFEKMAYGEVIDV
jgi:L-ascorbate metabolism protein UlaG (beta-lactamase superfamily)